MNEIKKIKNYLQKIKEKYSLIFLNNNYYLFILIF